MNDVVAGSPSRPIRSVRWLAPLVAGLVVLGLVACGKSTTTTTNASGGVVTTCTIRFAKTKFLLHAGLAAGAFHRYIYKPYRSGAFKQGAPGRKRALVKAGASAVFAYHELKVADQDARCDGPVLKKLARPLSAALDAISSLKGALSAGNFASVGGAAAALDKLIGKAAQNGVQIKDR